MDISCSDPLSMRNTLFSLIDFHFKNYNPKFLASITAQEFESLDSSEKNYFSNITIQKSPLSKKELFLFDHTNQITFISLAELIDLLVSSTTVYSIVFEICMYTYEFFTDEEHFFKLLLEKFLQRIPFGLGPSEKLIFFEMKMAPVQCKILNFFAVWIETHKNRVGREREERGEKDIFDLLEDCIYFMFKAEMKIKGLDGRLEDLLVNIEQIKLMRKMKREKEAMKSVKWRMDCLYTEFLRSVIADIISKTEEVAKQICLHDFKLFSKIEIKDLMLENQKKYKKITAFFNTITKNTALLFFVNLPFPQRKNLFQSLIKLIRKLIKYNNFNTSFSIFLGITHSSLRKLQLEQPLSSKQKSKLSSISSLFSFSQNYSSLRSQMQKSYPPSIPFLGILKKDLLVLNEAEKKHKSRKFTFFLPQPPPSPPLNPLASPPDPTEISPFTNSPLLYSPSPSPIFPLPPPILPSSSPILPPSSLLVYPLPITPFPSLATCPSFPPLPPPSSSPPIPSLPPPSSTTHSLSSSPPLTAFNSNEHNNKNPIIPEEINFMKMREIASYSKKLNLLQENGYEFDEEERISRFLKSFQDFEEEVLYQFAENIG